MAGYSGEPTEVVMGIRDKAKKKVKQLLPIVGAGGNQAPAAATPAAPSRPAVAPTPPPAAPPRDVQSFLDEVVKTNPVVLFMKGTPSSPMCGFSANAAGILQSYGGSFFHVDVIADPEVRQGIKDYSNWPTLPQIYVGGEFLGGSDILMQMHQAGELAELIEQAKTEA